MAATISCSSDVRCGAHGAGSGCTHIALHFVLAPQHSETTLESWVQYFNSKKPVQFVTHAILGLQQLQLTRSTHPHEQHLEHLSKRWTSLPFPCRHLNSLETT